MEKIASMDCMSLPRPKYMNIFVGRPKAQSRTARARNPKGAANVVAALGVLRRSALPCSVRTSPRQGYVITPIVRRRTLVQMPLQSSRKFMAMTLPDTISLMVIRIKVMVKAKAKVKAKARVRAKEKAKVVKGQAEAEVVAKVKVKERARSDSLLVGKTENENGGELSQPE